MHAYDVFVEPTTISHCVGCNFIDPDTKHLVVARTSILQVFEVLRPDKASSIKSPRKLKLVLQYKLQGRVTDLKTIRTIEAPDLDYILVSTEKAKFSCIKWDVSKHSIRSVSLHFYEHILEETTFDETSSSLLLVDPNSKALACLRQGNVLVFLPFHQSNEEDEGDDDEVDVNDDADEGKKSRKGEERENEGSLNAIDMANVDLYNGSLFEESTVLDINSLHSGIGEVIDMQFLNNYRRPTIAILSQEKRTWAGLLPTVKDNVQFTVLSLNLRAQTATTILRLENLPYDIDRIYPVPRPMHGSLLIGANELIHVDGSGISRRISSNEYVEDITSNNRGYTDQLQLNLKLENCAFAKIPNETKLLALLQDGSKYCLSFEMDGKAIKKVGFDNIETDTFARLSVHMPGDVAYLDDNLVFLSSRADDGRLIEFAKNHHDENAGFESDPQPKVEDEDDFYNDIDETSKAGSVPGLIEVYEHDTILNTGPTSTFATGHYSREKFVTNLPNPDFELVSIFANGGIADKSHMSIICPTIQPEIKTSLTFSQLNRLWTLSNKYLITSDDENNKSEIFDITQSYARLPAKQFIHTELTVAMHELNNGEFILQVTPKHVVLYNHKFKALKTLDDELSDLSDADIITSVFDDGFLMLFFSTGELVIYTVNTYSKAFTKIPLPKLLNEVLITTGYITNSRLLNAVTEDISLLTQRGLKRQRDGSLLKRSTPTSIMQQPKSKIFLVVTGDNRIVAFNRFHNEKCFQLNSAEKFSDYLSLGFFDITPGEPDPIIKQIVLNDLGDSHHKEEYLTILTVGGEIYCYKLFFDGANFKFIKETDTPITGAPYNAFAEGTSIERRMVYFPNISGYTSILVTGIVPFFIAKANQGVVRIFKFSKIPIVSFVPFSNSELKNAMIYLDTKKNARIVEIPLNFSYDNRLPIRRVHIGETIKSIAYHEGSGTFILSTLKEIPYDCLDFEGNPISGLKPEKPRVTSFKGLIKLLSSKTWTFIDSIELGDNEIGLQVKTMPLDVGSSVKRFKNRKEFILVGIGKYTTEDLVANGAYKLMEVIDIIPEPGKPETNHKLKEFTHEDLRGAVTSLCDVTGRFLIAQGQKIIVRDIKDNTAVPVAFLDTAVYVSETKSFGNFVLLGDTLKSVWLAGFDAEPFRMILLSKDVQGYEVSCADFLVKDEDLHVLISDSKGNLHVFQYNPEDPASSNGQRLLQKASFNANYRTSCMKNVPKFEQFHQATPPDRQAFQTIASTIEGAFFVVFPVSESCYRKLYILQQQLIDKEFHPCGLNPKMNRMGNNSTSDGSSRPLLDCELIRRYAKLNGDRKRTYMHKIGTNVQVDLWKDLIELENVLNIF